MYCPRSILFITPHPVNGSKYLLSVWPDWRFLKVFGTKFLTKVAQIISNFLDYFEKYNSYFKIYVTTYWETFRLLFTQTSGHTARCVTSSLSSAWVFRSCSYMLFGVLISSFSAIFLSLCFLFLFLLYRYFYFALILYLFSLCLYLYIFFSLYFCCTQSYLFLLIQFSLWFYCILSLLCLHVFSKYFYSMSILDQILYLLQLILLCLWTNLRFFPPSGFYHLFYSSLCTRTISFFIHVF